jgi:hypothetical protein
LRAIALLRASWIKSRHFAVALSGAMLTIQSLLAGYLIEPTLIKTNTVTVVTASATGTTRFYSGTTPPPYRFRLTQAGELLHVVEPATISPTKITFRLPRLEAGFYGFVIRAQNPVTGMWSNVYESSQRYFQVDADNDPALVFKGFDPASPEVRIPPGEFMRASLVQSSGSISGSVTLDRQITDGADVFDYGPFIYDFTDLESDPAGLKFTLDFNLAGKTKFDYNIPFNVSCAVPMRVYAGEPLYVQGSLAYTGSDTLRVDHDYASSTKNNLWVNVPYDMTAPLDLRLEQTPTELHIGGSYPVGPLSVDIDPPISLGGPFSDGEASINGVTMRLGGKPHYETSFSTALSAAGLFYQSWTGETTVPDVWKASGNQLAFLAGAGIPYVSQVAAVLTLAQVELNHTWNVNLKSKDFIHLTPCYLYDLQIPIRADTPAGAHRIQHTFSIPVRGYFVSQYTYEAATSIDFDMEFIDEIPIANWALDDFFFTQPPVEHTFYAQFTIDTTVEVLETSVFKSLYGDQTAFSNYTPSEASAERIRIDNLIFTAPPAPPIVTSVASGFLEPKPESQFPVLVTISPAGGGTVTRSPEPVDGGYAADAVVSLLAQPTNNYRFAGWSQDVVDSVNPVSVGMNGFKRITANFEKMPSLNVSFSDGQAVISWDPTATGYTLESATDLTPPVHWTTIPTGTVNQHTTATQGMPKRFFRLRYGN